MHNSTPQIYANECVYSGYCVRAYKWLCYGVGLSYRINTPFVRESVYMNIVGSWSQQLQLNDFKQTKFKQHISRDYRYNLNA